MSKEVRIIRADDLKALIDEYDASSWADVGESVLQVLREVVGEEKLAAMSWQELIRLGYRQGAGHLIIAMMAGEQFLELVSKGKAFAKFKALTDPVYGTEKKG